MGKMAQRGAGAAGRLAETWQAGWTPKNSQTIENTTYFEPLPRGSGELLGALGWSPGALRDGPWGLTGLPWAHPGPWGGPGGHQKSPKGLLLSACGTPESPKEPPAPSGHRFKIRCVFHCFGVFEGPGISRCRLRAHAGQGPWTPRSPLGRQGGSLTPRKGKLGVGREACRGSGTAGGPGSDGARGPGSECPQAC